MRGFCPSYSGLFPPSAYMRTLKTLGFFFLFPTRDALAEECHQAQECREMSCMLMYQSFIPRGFGESPGGDLLLESQSVLRSVFQTTELCPSLSLGCTTATRHEILHCQAYVLFSNWKLVNIHQSNSSCGQPLMGNAAVSLKRYLFLE